MYVQNNVSNASQDYNDYQFSMGCGVLLSTIFIFIVYFLHCWIDSSNCLPEMGCLNFTKRSPIGVALLISPWNLPLYLLTFKIAPAIATGILPIGLYILLKIRCLMHFNFKETPSFVSQVKLRASLHGCCAPC